jgi:DNA-binding transcriptional ArsR family regulator
MIRNPTLDGEEETLPWSLTTALDILGAPLRRSLLRQLAEHERPVSVTELAEFCADDAVLELESEQIAIALHHVHLPRLADYEIVACDLQENTVERIPDAAVVRTLFDLAPGC